jgi:site-specific recombinase XerD
MCYRDEQQLNAGDKLDQKIKNMPQFIQDYFEFLSSNNSKLSYWSTIRLFLEWLIDSNVIKNTLENITKDDLNQVTDVHLIKYFNGLMIGKYGDKISYNTVSRKKNNISGFWAYLVDKDYVRKNIVSKEVSKKYKKDDSNNAIEVPTDEQINTLLGNICNIKSEIIAIRNIAIVRLLMATGIRLSECVGLDMDDLHFDDPIPEITIWAKGKRSSRNVLIGSSAIDAVNEYLAIRELDEDMRYQKPLFLSERKDDNGNNKRISARAVQDFIGIYSNGEIHVHMLRHYAGTKMYENSNGDIAGVCEQLGHEDIKTTKKFYVKGNKSSMLEALNNI